MSTPLCLWSGPRNISTAMMRSFGARPDTVCWDEPFFAPWLAMTGVDHPGRAETLAECETDADAVCAAIRAGVDAPYHFQKHMAHHMIEGVPRDWMAGARHVLILRHPARVIASYARGRPEFVASDLGFAALRDIRDEIEQRTGTDPLVVETDMLLADPADGLRMICEYGFDIPYTDDMLSWEAGERDHDGPWAPYWYDAVIASTGFGPSPGPYPDVAAEHRAVYAECRADYDALLAYI